MEKRKPTAFWVGSRVTGPQQYLRNVEHNIGFLNKTHEPNTKISLYGPQLEMPLALQAIFSLCDVRTVGFPNHYSPLHGSELYLACAATDRWGHFQ